MSPRHQLRLLLVSAIAGVWAALLSVWLVGGALAQTGGTPPRATDPGNPCPAGRPVETFNVSLINIPLFLNRFGDVVPEGRMYILDEKIAEARATFQNAADPFHPADIIQPLVLRVNKLDCVEINFTNRLNEPAPAFNRNDSIFPLPHEVLRPQCTDTPNPGEFAPACTEPDIDFDPANAPAASMHFMGLDYDVRGSDGTAAGNNPDSTVPAGESITYRLFADIEGNFNFQDGADLSSHATQAGNFIGSNDFGSFGGIVVEPAGTTFHSIRTGEPIRSGTSAIIKGTGPDFREHALFMHDEVEAEPGILTRFCVGPADPNEPPDSECVEPNGQQQNKLQAGTLPGLGGGDADALINGEVANKLEWFAFNYRSEPGFNRDEVDCPARPGVFAAPECEGEEVSLSSWPFGDPGGGDLVFPNYRGEPMEIRLFHGAEKETHTFHWHIHRWPFDVDDEGGLARISRPDFHTRVTNPLDVQSVGPGSHYSLIPEGGAGSAHDDKPATFGDVIFHCHLYPHFADGMWGLNRVHDVLEDGTRLNPDTTPIQRLVPLDDFPAPPAPTDARRGFPFFVPGEAGFKAPKPPLGVASRQAGQPAGPTAEEIAHAEADAQVPGGFFINPCPANAPVKVFEFSAIQLNVQYNNDLNWRDPQHRIYVLNEQKADVLAGRRKPEPFSPLLNVGDCVVHKVTNELPRLFGGNVFDRLQVTNEVSIHQHMVQFDVLTSDGAANGWNYDQGADNFGGDRTITFRDFVSADVRTNSFHDHLFPNVHQDSGLFGGSSIHPAGCTFHDPVTGDPVTVGTIVDVRCTPTVDDHGNPTDGEDYRNASLFVEDQVPMFQPEDPNDPNDDQFVTPDGVPIFPAKFPSSPDDKGVMGVNYTLEPFEARRDADPSKLFDSKTHGDPFTPQPRAFAGDLVKFRMFQLSMEESHGFNLHRWRWKFEPNDPESRLQQAEHIGMLEYFEQRIPTDKEQAAPNALELRDYLYYYGGADDWFLGAWGLFRVSGCNFNQIQGLGKKFGIQKLQELPDNSGIRQCNISTIPQREPGNPCPSDPDGNIIAPIKRFTVVAINNDVVFNNAGEHDPNGVIYVLEEDLADVRSGAKRPEPLVLRVNKGDCIEVTLRNELDPNKMQPHCFEALEPGQLGFDDPRPDNLQLPQCLDEPPNDENEVPGFQPFPVSARVSLNPKGVNYHIGSDGANVGVNFDTTVAPGNSILYRWFAEDEFGLGLLGDRGDVQNHLHHGLFGGLVSEPLGSTYLDPKTGSPIKSGQEAVVIDPVGPDFRENIVMMNSDLSLFQQDGFPVADNRDLRIENSDEADDPEDQGEFSINYRNEPWVHRFLNNPNLALIFSSIVHGDPATPLFRAYGGDFVRFRVAQAEGDPRATSFTLHGHRWRRSPNDPESQIAALQGQFNPGETFNIHLDPRLFGGVRVGGAGGPNEFPGDYLYRSNTLFRHLTGGQWGIFRVFGVGQPDLIPLPDNPI
jgi:hypothetical protein